MKKELLLAFLVCSLSLLQHTANASSNGTIVNGYYMIEDFNGTTPSYSTTGASVTTPAYPVGSQGNAVRLSVTSNNGYFTIPVTLPSGRVLSNNDSLVFDLYHQSGTWKQLRVHLGSTHAGSSSHAYDFGGNYLGGNPPTNMGTRRVAINQLTGYTTAGNSFRLGFGIDYATTEVFIDNIRLAYTLSTAPTVSDADNINATSFTANWETLFGVENYRLDVATDAAFTSMVTGYNNLNVGNVTNFEVTGLTENVTYYYRVRGAKTGGNSPYSSTISLITQTAGPVDPYVAPNLDPVAETDPTPATITVPTIFVIDDYESKSINDALLVNNSSNATSSVKANPTNGSQKSAYVRVTNWDGYLRLNVQLPIGKVMSDYTTLSFDEYLDNGYDHNFKDIRVNINNVQAFSVASGQVTYAAWTTRSFTLTGNSQVNSAGNSFTLDLGMRTANGSFYIDNVKLIPPAAPTATTATAATHIYATSFKAQWSFFQGSTAYFLDVATNNTFTNIVSGYNNLNVGNVANHVVTGLTPGTTYYYRVRGTNTSTQSNTITVATKAGTTAASHFATRASGNISDIATWQSSTNNTGWMNATAAPTGDAKSIRVLKNHELTVDDNFSAAEIIVRAGGKLNVASGKQLSLTGRIFLESDADGTATLVNEGTVTVGGHAVVKQYFGTARNWYVSSPVATALAPETNITRYYEYVEAGNNNPEGQPAGSTAFWKGLNTGHTMAVGKGYIAQVNAGVTVEFSGALNNNISYPVTVTRTASAGSSAGFNLVGNPYPAYLDWSNVIADPLNANVGTTFWYRTKNTENAYTFTTHNGTSGITVTGSANTEITRLIPPMQAFWVRVNNNNESTQLVLKKTMLNHRDVANNKFKAPQNDANAVLRLQISNGNRDDETVLYFNNKASIAFDHYDSPKMFNNNAVIPEIYTRAGNERLVINGMNGYDFNTMIPLGFVAGQAGSFSIRSSELQNFDSDTQVYLLDKTSNSQFNLTTGESYNFTSDATSTEDRFAVLFKSASGTSSVGDNAVSGMYLSAQNGRLTLQLNTAIDNAQATVFNAAGQSIYSQAVSAPTTVLSKSLDAGVYVVKIVNGGRTTVLRTIIH